jgi:hypothetical protein
VDDRVVPIGGALQGPVSRATEATMSLEAEAIDAVVATWKAALTDEEKAAAFEEMRRLVYRIKREQTERELKAFEERHRNRP